MVTWAMPLRLHLSVIILGLLACTSLPLIFITYSQGKFAALSSGEGQMRQLGLRVIEDYRNVFREGYSAIVAASAVPEMTTPPPYDADTKETFLLNVLRSSFRVDNLYAGYPDGSFVQVVDAADNAEWRADVNAPTEAAYAVRTIDRSNGGPNTVWSFYGKDMRLLKRAADRDDIFDPRTRPWYKVAVNASKAVSVGPYISASTNFLTMTVATPTAANRHVVIGADVMLVTLGDIVDISAVSEHARAYVFDQDVNLIVHSDRDLMSEVRGRLRRGREVSLADFARVDPALPAVAHLLESGGAQTGAITHFKAGAREYLAEVSREAVAGLGRKYTVAIVAPLSDLVGPVEQRLTRNLAIAAFCLAVGILAAIFISRLVSRSLYVLAEEATQLGKLEVRESRIVHSWISEVNALAKALRSARHAISTFSLYVPRELVRRIVIAGQANVGAAVRQDVTVLFTDIRDFTTISEENSPEEVVALLSEYFEALNKIVERHGGTIVQYMGDAILAMWNAPLHDPDHVEHACHCALAMKQAVDAMNHANSVSGRPVLITRFGLHTGAAVVGSVGAEARLQYTAIGDTVNIASRLEGLNRQYGTSILVSGAIRDTVGQVFELAPVGVVSVKGRSGQTELLELRGAI